MLDATPTPEMLVPPVVKNELHPKDFTPLGDHLYELKAQAKEPVSTTTSLGPDQDYLKELKEQLQQAAVEQGLDPDKVVPENADGQPEPQQRRIGLVKRIKSFFTRSWNWSKDFINKFVKNLERRNIIAKRPEPVPPLRESQPLAPPQPV